MTMDRVTFSVLHLTEVIYWLSHDVEYSSQSSLAHWHRDWTTGVDGLHAANHTVGGQHGNRAHATLAKVLLHFRDQIDLGRNIEPFGNDSEGLIDRRQKACHEFNVNHRANNLDHAPRLMDGGRRI